MRGMVSESDNPLLFASTYQAGDFVAYTGEPDAEPAVVARKRTGARAPARARLRVLCAPTCRTLTAAAVLRAAQ